MFRPSSTETNMFDSRNIYVSTKLDRKIYVYPEKKAGHTIPLREEKQLMQLY